MNAEVMNPEAMNPEAMNAEVIARFAPADGRPDAGAHPAPGASIREALASGVNPGEATRLVSRGRDFCGR
jgi:hypothetical protein